MSLAQQLGNAGSEFHRALSWQARGDDEKFNQAAARFIELMDLTVTDPRWTGRRRRELARVREAGTEELENQDEVTKSLQKYFDHFALYARNQ